MGAVLVHKNIAALARKPQQRFGLGGGADNLVFEKKTHTHN
jgi:hypothetical protein